LSTSAGEADGFWLRAKAAAPATWGQAMEVPDMTALAVFDVMPAEVMLEPGANKSTHVPKLL